MILLAAGPAPGLIVLVVLAVIFLVMSIVIVPEKSAKVIQRLGKFNRIAFSGLSFKKMVIYYEISIWFFEH